jgi:hypothetical protein
VVSFLRLNATQKRGQIAATRTGYAYETIPNKPIITGKTKGPDVITLDPARLGHLLSARLRFRPGAAREIEPELWTIRAEKLGKAAEPFLGNAPSQMARRNIHLPPVCREVELVRSSGDVLRVSESRSFDFVTASLTRSSHFAQDDQTRANVHQPIRFLNSMICAV